MLISPKHEFILFKPMKTAGSSIEKALLKYCTSEGLCTGGTSNSLGALRLITGDKVYLEDEYEARNNEYVEGDIKTTRFHSHVWPELFFRSIANPSVYKDFKKVTIVRNPWDLAVSYYWWGSTGWKGDEKRLIIKENDSKRKANAKFKFWITNKFFFQSYEKLKEKFHIKPVEYLSDINEKFIDADIITDYILYENIESDYKKIFNYLVDDNEELEVLPHLKSNIRKLKKHYSFYYDYETRKIVEYSFKKTINSFNYKFKKEYNYGH
jgi:hypothetical protein